MKEGTKEAFLTFWSEPNNSPRWTRPGANDATKQWTQCTDPSPQFYTIDYRPGMCQKKKWEFRDLF